VIEDLGLMSSKEIKNGEASKFENAQISSVGKDANFT
jgi:hypothetical protein